MDNNNDIILPEIEETPHIEASASKTQKSRQSFFLIIAAIVFVILVGALVFIVLNHSQAENNSNDSEETPKSSSFRYDNDAFNSVMSVAEERLNVRDYMGFEDILGKFSMPERMTVTQKYRYYSLKALYYSPDNTDNPELYAKYNALVEDSLTQIRKGEE